MVTGYEIFLRLFLSALFGGIIGLEREVRARSAGLRTHVLVGLGCTLFMIVSQYIWYVYRDTAQVDPSRIAAQIITGIGFIGAGTIMKSRFTMRGLTTAASIWTVASIGMAVGTGLYWVALFTTMIALLILTLLEKVEQVMKKNWYKIISILAENRLEIVETLKADITKYGGIIMSFSVECDKGNNTLQVDTTVRFRARHPREDLVAELTKIEGVRRVKCE